MCERGRGRVIKERSKKSNYGPAEPREERKEMTKNISLTLKDWLALEKITNYWRFDASPRSKKYLNELHDKIVAHAELAEKQEGGS